MSDYVIAKEIRPFVDEKGRMTALPAKNRKKLYALYYLATRLDADAQWNEEQISILLDELTTFHDSATLRRELYNKRLLHRTDDGKCYWREKELPDEAEFIASHI